ncbi:MAG: tRNA adenosine(34) deaminase TadA [Candidatus Latescibacteria bacterium]|jgi:tRNA(adenine34) deaminase|nr:tRNA adenosine(34) deaminase TadA [Candidatus Latescibacterota bacterium]
MFAMDAKQIAVHERWMHEALQEARDAGDAHDVPVGAVVVRDGEVIGRGQNLVERRHDPTAHAEICAIREATESVGYQRLTGAQLYVTLEPCAMCAGAIVLSRIQSLIIGASDPKTGACGTIMNLVQHERLNHSVDVVTGILVADCSLILTQFFRAKRRAGKLSS